MSNGRRPPTAFSLDEVEFGEPADVWPASPGERELPPGRKRPAPPRESLDRQTAGEDRSEPVPVAEQVGVPPPRRSVWWNLFLSGLGGLAAIALGFAVERMIADLFAVTPLFGWLALGCALAAVMGAVALGIREWFALRRLDRLDRIRASAAEAVEADDRAKAVAALKTLVAFYETRPETARGRTALLAHFEEVIDGRDLVEIGERELLSDFDAEAMQTIIRAAKRVTLVTALSPRALIDVAYVVIASVGLVRTLAGIYGGRPGMLGFMRILRHAVAHLAVTGGMAVGDSLVGELVGQSIASRLSARLGEGVVNGLMTARLGLSAMDVLRPLPFVGTRRPRVTDVVKELSRLAGDAKSPKGS